MATCMADLVTCTYDFQIFAVEAFHMDNILKTNIDDLNASISEEKILVWWNKTFPLN